MGAPQNDGVGFEVTVFGSIEITPDDSVRDTAIGPALFGQSDQKLTGLLPDPGLWITFGYRPFVCAETNCRLSRQNQM